MLNIADYAISLCDILSNEQVNKFENYLLYISAEWLIGLFSNSDKKNRKLKICFENIGRFLDNFKISEEELDKQSRKF